jgi:hypothetical protein
MGKAPKRSPREIRREPIEWEMPGGRERSLTEWMNERAEKYRDLRSQAVPTDFIDAAEAFRMNDKVTWFRERDAFTGEPVQISFELTSNPSLPARTIASSAYARSTKEEAVITVSEALAMTLRIRLGDLDREQGNAPVRSKGLLSHRSMSDIAVDLLDCCYALSTPPGPQLITLIESLLGAWQPRLKSTRQFDARQRAIWIEAGQPGLSTRALADKVEVHGTTVMRWRKDPNYQKAVRERRRRATRRTAGKAS